MDPNVQKWTFLAFLVAELFACNLALVALSVIEIPTIIIDRGVTPLSSHLGKSFQRRQIELRSS